MVEGSEWVWMLNIAAGRRVGFHVGPERDRLRGRIRLRTSRFHERTLLASRRTGCPVPLDRSKDPGRGLAPHRGADPFSGQCREDPAGNLRFRIK